MNLDTQHHSSLVLILNDQRVLVLASPNASLLFGYERDEMAGMPIAKIVAASSELLNETGVRLIGINQKVTGLTKAGSDISLNVCLNQFQSENEIFTIIHIANPRYEEPETSFINEGAMILDTTGHIAFINAAGCNLVGGSEEIITGLNWFENFLPEDSVEPMQEIFKQIFLTGSNENYESQLLTLRGERHTIGWASFVLFNSARLPIGTLNFAVDTGKKTDREADRHHIIRISKLIKQLESRVKKQTQALEDSLARMEGINRDLQLQIEKRKDIEQKFMKIQRLYDTVVHNFPNGVIGVLNNKMKYVLIDGKDLSEIDMPALGLTDQRNSTPEDSALAERTIRKIKKAFDGSTISFEVKTKDRFYSITAVPLPDTHNKINEVLCVLQNITRQKEMEEGLMKALEQERELGELKSRFVTMACHEFKTPLATILSSNFLLENYTKADYEKEKLVHTSRIKRSVNNLTMILNEFLLSEKLEENMVEVVNVEVNVPKYIGELLVEAETIKQKGQTIEYRHIGNQQHVHLAPHILWSILTNLISNSLKYSKKGDTVILTTEIKNNSLIIFLKDHGIGIPTEEVSYIFERFYRARNAVNFKGTGLGLHIVEKHINLFNGTISVSSQVNVGTEFTVVLPNGTRKRPPEPSLFDNLIMGNEQKHGSSNHKR